MSKIDTAVKVGTKVGIYALQGLVVAGGMSAGTLAGIAWADSKLRNDILIACSNSNTKAQSVVNTMVKTHVKVNDFMVPVSAAGLSMLGSAFFISSFFEVGKLIGANIVKVIK